MYQKQAEFMSVSRKLPGSTPTAKTPDEPAAAQAAQALDRSFSLLRLATCHALKLQDDLDNWFSDMVQSTPAQGAAAEGLTPAARSTRAEAYLGWIDQARAGGAKLLARAAEADRPDLAQAVERHAEDLCRSSVALLEADVHALSRWQ